MSTELGKTPLRYMSAYGRAKFGNALYETVVNTGYHRTQVVQALRTIGAGQKETVEAIRNGLAATTNRLSRDFNAVGEGIATLGSDLQALGSDLLMSISDLGNGLQEGLERMSAGIFELHADNLRTHEILGDMLEAIAYPDQYRRRVAALRAQAADEARKRSARGEYQAAMQMVRKASEEPIEAKADAMYREACWRLDKDVRHEEILPVANLQLGTLHDSYFGDTDTARAYYRAANTGGFSSWNTRVSQVLANMEYRCKNFDASLNCLKPLVDFDYEICSFADGLRAVKDADWTVKETRLRDLLQSHRRAQAASGHTSALSDLLARNRGFSACEAIEKNCDDMIADLYECRPIVDVFQEAAKPAAELGQHDLAETWLQRAFDRLDGDDVDISISARKLLLAEVSATPCLRNL